ncbi:glycosyltransferase family A protein [Polaribacter atrinae]|uniref:glycosyltransferase family A protein n=1 Tax=Polaribacter atrinae TaxID=1333662 RepID=UPI002492CB95|nr:glycosyltransferase family A protein [Polaribacter atrinae]
MREGFNPNKDKKLTKSDCFHQVIIPVYIPNNKGYFKDSFQILKYCLESLFKTSHTNTYFTIVNNGSCIQVVHYLNNLHQNGKINELIHTSSIGKLNAILKGLIGQKFKLVTITDADVLFLDSWQEETYKIFNTFPKAGAVSPVPSSKVLKQFTSNIIIDNIFSNKLKFTKVLNPRALKMFAESIGNNNFYSRIHLQKNLTIQQNNIKAVVGAGHFVVTYRGDVFKNIKQKFSEYSLGGRSESNILDKPVLMNGFWRISTQDNYAFHMGNVAESWMEECLNEIKSTLNEKIDKPVLKKVKYSNMGLFFKNSLFINIICYKLVWSLFLRFKGLTKKEAKEY